MTRRRAIAFTLIELLVVIALIALLAALLVPTLAQMRQRAKKTYCMGNLRQFGTAFQTYADDSDGWLPFPMIQASAGGGTGWIVMTPSSFSQDPKGVLVSHGRLYDYLSRNAQVYYCPDFKTDSPPPNGKLRTPGAAAAEFRYRLGVQYTWYSTYLMRGVERTNTNGWYELCPSSSAIELSL